MTRAGDLHAAWRDLPVADLATIMGPGPVVILSPHPDDESLGCGGLIAALCRAGRPPMVVMLTDGTGSHQGSLGTTPQELRDLREREAIEAVGLLGLQPERLVFLRLRDTAAPHDGPAFDNAVARLVSLMDRDATICAPWKFDPHCDHVAAHLIARAAAARTGARFLAYPVWGWMLPPEEEVAEDGSRAGWRLDIQADLVGKHAAVAAHRSQHGRVIADDPGGFSLPAGLLAIFARPYETFLLCAE